MERTRRLVFSILILATQVSVSAALAQDSSTDFAELKALYDEKVAEVDAAEVKEKEKLVARFADAVERIRDEAQASGKLEQAVEAKRDIEAARAGSLLNRENEEAELPEKLVRLREIAARELRVIQSEASEKRSTLATQYMSALKKAREDLTKEGKLEEALAVSEEIQTVSAAIAELSRPKTESDGPREIPAALTKNLRVYFSLDTDEKELKNGGDARIKGIVEGGTFVKEGRVGGARRFNGVSDRIILDGDLPDSSELTVAMWVKCDETGTGGGLFCDYGPKSANDVMYGILGGNAVEVRADKDGATLRRNVPLNTDILGSWHHLVWVMGRRESIIYLDGRKVGQVEETGSNRGEHNGFLAYSHVGGAYRYFHGEIDEIMIWSNALEEAEVRLAYGMR